MLFVYYISFFTFSFISSLVYSHISFEPRTFLCCMPPTLDFLALCSRQSAPPLESLNKSGRKLSIVFAKQASAVSPASKSSNRARSSSCSFCVANLAFSFILHTRKTSLDPKRKTHPSYCLQVQLKIAHPQK